MKQLCNKIRFVNADNANLKRRVYGVSAFSTTPKEVGEIIKKKYPDFKLSHKSDFRQDIADLWPENLDVDKAKRHWGFSCDYDLQKSFDQMMTDIVDIVEKNK